MTDLNKNFNNLYSLQIDIKNSSSVVQIETLITKGLYRFTILGIPHKEASDTKDRVYAALRSNNLLNLKSDNRKIIVSLHPDKTLKKENIYDLGIAFSCIAHIQKKNWTNSMLIIGELSLTGRIIPTKRLYQAIYTAYNENIPVILCSSDDVKTLSSEMIEKISTLGISILHSHYIQDLLMQVDDFYEKKQKQSLFPTITNINQKTIKEPSLETPIHLKDIVKLESLDQTLACIYISLCGGHKACIETSGIKEFKKIYEPYITYKPKEYAGQSLYTKYINKLHDDVTHTKTTYIDNLKLERKETVESYEDTVIATHTPCICGYKHAFFTNAEERRCICSKKSIIQHKRYLEDSFFHLFSMYTTNTQNYVQTVDIKTIHKQIDFVRDIQFKRFVSCMNLSEREEAMFPNKTYLNEYMNSKDIEKNLDTKAQNIWKQSYTQEKLLQVAQTIQDILDFETNHKNIEVTQSLHTHKTHISKEKPAVSEQALLLALSYSIKMDF